MSVLSLSRDEILEVFIRAYVEGISIPQSIAVVVERESTEDYQVFNEKCEQMWNGWIRMNENIRKLGK